MPQSWPVPPSGLPSDSLTVDPQLSIRLATVSDIYTYTLTNVSDIYKPINVSLKDIIKVSQPEFHPAMVAQVVKCSTCCTGDMGSIPGPDTCDEQKLGKSCTGGVTL